MYFYLFAQDEIEMEWDFAKKINKKNISADKSDTIFWVEEEAGNGFLRIVNFINFTGGKTGNGFGS